MDPVHYWQYGFRAATECRDFLSMINIAEINNQLVQQDEVLRARLAEVAARVESDSATSALVEVLSESMTAIHDRQGNLILLMLQTNT